MAYHAGRLGIPATIVMPEATPFTKVKYTKDFGAEVLLEGADLNEATARAREIAARALTEGVRCIPSADPLVIVGQGTIALEMLEDFPDLRCHRRCRWAAAVCIAGIQQVAAKALQTRHRYRWRPDRAYPAMRAVMTDSRAPPLASLPTIAEGIAVKQPGHVTRTIAAELVKDIFIVSEAEIEHARWQ